MGGGETWSREARRSTAARTASYASLFPGDLTLGGGWDVGAGRPLLDVFARAEEAVEGVAQGCRGFRPGPGLGGVLGVGGDLGDEGREGSCVCSLALAVLVLGARTGVSGKAVEAVLPGLCSAGDVRRPRAPVPARGWGPVSWGSEDRGVGQPLDQVGPRVVVSVHGEQTADRPARGRLGERRVRGGVEGQACFVEDLDECAEVGVGVAVGDGDALRPGPVGVEVLEDAANGEPRLLVGVGGDDDRHVGRGRRFVPLGLAEVRGEPLEDLVVIRSAGDADDGGEPVSRGERFEETAVGGPKEAGREEDDVGLRCMPSVEGCDGRFDGIHGAGVGAAEFTPVRAVEVGDFLGPRAPRSERVEGSGANGVGPVEFRQQGLNDVEGSGVLLCGLHQRSADPLERSAESEGASVSMNRTFPGEREMTRGEALGQLRQG